MHQSNDAPIFIVEDDSDDNIVYADIILNLEEAPRPIRFFCNGRDVIQYFSTNQPLPCLIISDVNLPMVNGIELKNSLQTHQRVELRTIPFIFLSTSIDKHKLNEMYGDNLHGAFQKPDNYDDMKIIIKSILDQWG